MKTRVWAQHINWWWVAIYTSGLTELQKLTRRDEVTSDMHEHLTFARSAGETTWSLEREISSRLVRGIIGDVFWRLEAGRDGEAAVRMRASPPMPWLSSLFLSAVVVFGTFNSTLASWQNETHVSLAMLAIIGAGLAFWGLYLATHRFFGPLFVALGSVCVAWSLWWTFVGPLAATAVAVAGIRRAHRIEKMLDS